MANRQCWYEAERRTILDLWDALLSGGVESAREVAEGMRRAAKVDGNQGVIVEAMRGAGASVRILSMVGGGCPDMLVGFRGRNFLLEVKRPKAKGQSAGTTTPEQDRFFAAWRGQATVVRTADDALRAIGAVL